MPRGGNTGSGREYRKPSRKPRYTEEDVRASLEECIRRYGDITVALVDEDPDLYDAHIVKTVFGSMGNAKSEVGLKDTTIYRCPYNGKNYQNLITHWHRDSDIELPDDFVPGMSHEEYFGNANTQFSFDDVLVEGHSPPDFDFERVNSIDWDNTEQSTFDDVEDPATVTVEPTNADSSVGESAGSSESSGFIGRVLGRLRR